MSRAGKFIPGGGGKGARTGPIRAPDPSAPPPDPNAPPGAKKPFGKGSLVKPVAKSQRLPIAIMSGIVCCVLVSAGWYFLAYQPAVREKALIEDQISKMKADEIQREKDEELRKQKEHDLLMAQRGIFMADTNPSGAKVVMGDSQGTAPVKFTNLIPGPFTVQIHLDGYEDFKQDVTVSADQPTDLGTITLVQKMGNLSITSQQSGVTYKITGPGDYAHEGDVPDKLEKLPVGDYVISAAQGDWKLSPIPITIHDHDNIQKEIKFPYAKLSITSVPPGATVREGHTILGQTPVSLAQVHPGDFHLSVDLPPYTFQRLDFKVPDFGVVTKEVKLQQDKDFIAACGMPMVWIQDGGFWAGKYLVRQSDFEAAGGVNPSTFRRPSRPVETISWDAAMAFCDKLNDYERKAGKLPQGYHYTLPKESQWSTFSADADIDLAAMSRAKTLSSTQDVGYSEPNKYGLYDSIGNVWEWCLDTFDEKGNHTMRGGSWLSSPENFPGVDTRNAAAPKYADQFIGFRVVLVPN